MDGMSDQTPDITVRGAWQGQSGDPARTFHGTITHSGHPDAPTGSACRVTFEHSGQRVTTAADHGTYVLHTTDPASRVVLARFSSSAGSSARPADESLDDDWYALPAQP